MSWYSDGERFDEYDPPYCERCTRDTDYDMCQRCMQRHDEEEDGTSVFEELNNEIITEVEKVVNNYCAGCEFCEFDEEVWCDKCVVTKILRAMDIE